MTPNFSAPACMHSSPVAALALRPSGACQTYQSRFFRFLVRASRDLWAFILGEGHRAPGGVGGCRLCQPSLFQQGVVGTFA